MKELAEAEAEAVHGEDVEDLLGLFGLDVLDGVEGALDEVVPPLGVDLLEEVVM